jgi:signal transduction histidine kinase
MRAAPKPLGEVASVLGVNSLAVLMPPIPGRPLALLVRAAHQADLPQDLSADDALITELGQAGTSVLTTGTESGIAEQIRGGRSDDLVVCASAGIRERLPVIVVASVSGPRWQAELLQQSIRSVAREYASAFLACREMANKVHFAQAVTHEMIGPARAIRSVGRILTEDREHITPQKALLRLEELTSLTDLLMTRAIGFQRAADIASMALGELAEVPVRRLDNGSSRRTGAVRTTQASRDLIGIIMECVRAYQIVAREEAADESDQITEFGIDFESFDPLETVTADIGLLKHALMNLIDNAVKYSTPGSRIRIYGAVRGNTKVIGVENEGLPFEESLEVATQLFSRGSRASQVRPTGTGIGLALVRVCSELHEWKLDMRQKQRPDGSARVVLEILIGPDAVSGKTQPVPRGGD